MKKLVCLSIFAISCVQVPKIDNGLVKGLDYINKSLGFRITLPEGWAIISNEETVKLLNRTKRNLPQKELKKYWLNLNKKALVSCYRFRDADMKRNFEITINPNITVFIEYLPSSSGVFNAHDYIPYFKRSLLKQEYIVPSSIVETKKKLSEVHFEQVDYQLFFLEKSVSKSSFLYMYGTHLINITLSWETGDEETHQVLMKSFLSIQLKPGNI